MHPHRRIPWFLSGFLLVAFLAPVQAQPEAKKPAPSKFIRIQKDMKEQPVALETAIVRYRPASGKGDLVVDLVGVVHIGEAAYYRKLNKHFEQYDVLLYELVGPPGAKPVKGARSDNPLAWVQKIMTLVLDLDSQLEHIDYTKKNFVHADMSPEEMAKAIKKRGDDGLTLALSIAADILRKHNMEAQRPKGKGAPPPELPDITSLLTDPAAPSKIKRMLASQFEDLEAGGGLGPTLDTILVADRNQAALKVLSKELAKGHKKIGIFYGAAHMPDFEKRLREDFDLVPVSTIWMPAWDLRLRERGLEDLLFRLLRDGLP
jgi:hypothetical protein